MTDKSHLSSRVLNMKFMRVADERGAEEEQQGKKLKDLSEWKMPNAASFKMAKKRKKLTVVGYTSMNLMKTSDGLNAGRRVLGAKKEEKGEDEEDEEQKPSDDYEPEQPEQPANSKSLLELWTENKKEPTKGVKKPKKKRSRKKKKPAAEE